MLMPYNCMLLPYIFLIALSDTHHAFFRKTIKRVITNDNMIQHFDVHQFARGNQFLREFFIFRAGSDVGAGMIVHANYRCRKFLQSRVNDFTHNRHRVIDSAIGGIRYFDYFVVAVDALLYVKKNGRKVGSPLERSSS